MENTTIKAFAAALIAAGTAVWGWMGWLVIAWLACMVMDYLTGSLAAAKNGEWSSSRAREGLWHKGGMLLVVFVAVGADVLIGLLLNNTAIRLPFTYTALITPIVIAWYTVTELGSVIENAAKMGAPIPKWLKKILKITADAIDKTGNGIAGEDKDDEKDGD